VLLNTAKIGVIASVEDVVDVALPEIHGRACAGRERVRHAEFVVGVVFRLEIVGYVVAKARKHHGCFAGVFQERRSVETAVVCVEDVAAIELTVELEARAQLSARDVAGRVIVA
jgi:hypothetical protein